MGEIEKLRSLLAEARDALEPVAEGVPLLMDRIYAALAEPYNVPINEQCSGEHGCANLGLEKNIWTPEYDYCDERNITHYPPCPLAYSQSDNNPAASPVEGFVALLAEPVKDDFKRGAEAMREAAAKDCIDFWGKGHASGVRQAGRIRALPIPEDRP